MGNAFGPNPYGLSLERLSLFAKETGSKIVSDAGLSLALEGSDQSVKAFWNEGQRVVLALNLTNNSAEQRRIKLHSASSNYLWKPSASTESLTLNPGQTQRIPVTIDIGAQTPSNEEIRIGLQAETAEGALSEANADFQPQCDVPPAKPGPDHRLPGSMLGGMNLAWASLGGALPDVEEKNREDPSRYMGIIDGYTPLTSSWHVYGDFPVDVPVRLAVIAPVSGVTLNPTGCAGGGAVRQFEVWSSADGLEFMQVLEGALSTLRKEQVFSFPAPVMSGYLKLRVRSTWKDDKKGRVCLGELKALADPESDFSGGDGWNIADPKFGGHVVWSGFKTNAPTWPEVLSAKGSKRSFGADPDNPNEWVVGFHHNRAAQIREIRWQRQIRSREPNELSRVDVAVSQDSPIGPWRSIGALSIDRSNEVSSLRFDDPVWARFVKFSSTDPDRAAKWQLPARLQIFERIAGTGYRSMLGEWGHYAQNSVFEFLQEGQPASVSTVKSVTGNGSKAKARALKSGEKVAGQVQRGKDDDWYRLSVPQGQNQLRIDLSGIPTLLVEPQLINANGDNVELKRDDKDAAHSYYSAAVVPGNYLLQIREPIMSTVITWDNSGSVSPYATSIYQALEEFARGVAPQNELVNFLPFQQKQYDLLSREWTDQPLLLAEALNNYDRSDASSAAEGNLLAAVKYLRERHGNKMVLIVTDAASGKPDNRSLWQALSQVMPHIFTVELHGGDFADQQDKMQDWAAANGGIYASFQTQPDLDIAFDRALCTMRRPAGYQLAVQSEFQKPRGPGTLRVSVDSAAVAASSAVEIILDASGSMYRKIGDQTRIAVAKIVLTELLHTTIPAGTPLALRIYGHREARSCRTDLELPLRPLVAADALKIIKSVDPQDRSRTPLADSLKLVAEDLMEATGPRLVILLTDGEESCDGDPEAAIRFLKEQGMNIKLNIVGMAIDSDVAKQQFSEWAKIGGGLYFDADSPEALQAALEKSLFPKYQLIDQNGDVAVEAVADGRSIEVAEGTYQLKVLTTPSRAMGEIRIEEGENVEIVVGPQ
jgi:Mg-chelatase subunit ChlD